MNRWASRSCILFLYMKSVISVVQVVVVIIYVNVFHKFLSLAKDINDTAKRRINMVCGYDLVLCNDADFNM